MAHLGLRVFLLFTLFVSFANSEEQLKTVIKTLLEKPLQNPTPGCDGNLLGTVLELDLPAGDMGLIPHTHPGPVLGYVLQGQILFQVRDFYTECLIQGAPILTSVFGYVL